MAINYVNSGDRITYLIPSGVTFKSGTESNGIVTAEPVSGSIKMGVAAAHADIDDSEVDVILVTSL